MDEDVERLRRAPLDPSSALALVVAGTRTGRFFDEAWSLAAAQAPDEVVAQVARTMPRELLAWLFRTPAHDRVLRALEREEELAVPIALACEQRSRLDPVLRYVRRRWERELPELFRPVTPSRWRLAGPRRARNGKTERDRAHALLGHAQRLRTPALLPWVTDHLSSRDRALAARARRAFTLLSGQDAPPLDPVALVARWREWIESTR